MTGVHNVCEFTWFLLIRTLQCKPGLI
ncbi:hypothetical protein AHF37_12809 [Paragonimus kellicotti]|nr:hypothetical protein AHF37_12809 [Paragonimus kellicotti]